MASELKPCPLCSADPSSKFTDIKAAIWCEPCGLHMEYSTAMVSLRIAEEHQRSILTKCWNTRPTPVAPVSPDATGEPWPYQKTFNAIAAATRLEGGCIFISVKDFVEAFGPTPDATGKCGELETVAHMAKSRMGWVPTPHWSGEAVVTRSQAVELLAAKDDECKDIEATLSAWFDTKKITEDSLKPLMVAAVKGYLRTCSSGGMPQELIDEVLPAVECMIDYGVFAESVTQYTMSLKADNAALTARVKELEKDFYDADKSDMSARDLLNDREAEIEALETQLAAAEKALEPFVSFFNEAMKGFTEGYAERTPSDKPVLGWNNAYLLMRDFIEARAVLGGRPS